MCTRLRAIQCSPHPRRGSPLGWHVGAGLEVKVAPRVALYGEGRAVFLDPERDLDSSVFNQVEDFDYNSTYFVGGLNFLF